MSDLKSNGISNNGGDGQLVPEPQAVAWLKPYNIAYPDHEFATDAETAVLAANKVGYPVVLKVVSPDISHKSDVGGVMVGLGDDTQVVRGYVQMMYAVRSAVPHARIQGALVCRQVPGGVEAIVGAVEDPVFGPTLMFGLGGLFTESLKDVSFRIAPVGKTHAEDMIREIKGFALLAGARNRPPCDLDAAAALIRSVSRLVMENPVQSLDLNPVYLYPQGAVAVDVRIIKRRRDG